MRRPDGRRGALLRLLRRAALPLIKYIGSKRLLVPRIVAAARSLRAEAGVRRVADLFSGTSRVGRALKAEGFDVAANDHLAFAHVLARCYVAADARRLAARAERLVRDLARARPRSVDGWFTETYAREARYFRPENAARIEGIREAIARRDLPAGLEAIALTSLLEAADRVDSTVGLQMAFLKRWAPRAFDPLDLRPPALLPGGGIATRLDAAEAAARLEADLAYLDPPYNQHSYLGNYHVWETLVRWDRPEVYGVARKRVDCRSRRSAFNGRRSARAALEAVVAATPARWILVSFNDEGHLSRDDLEEILAARGRVEARAVRHPRYVGSKIGIHNPRGERVGTPGPAENREFLFLAGPDAAVARRALDGAEAAAAA